MHGAISSSRAAGIWPQSPNKFTVTLDVLTKPVTSFAVTEERLREEFLTLKFETSIEMPRD